MLSSGFPFFDFSGLSETETLGDGTVGFKFGHFGSFLTK